VTRLVVEGLRRRFADRDVLDGVGFEITAGETVALMGPSGCGKTTLLQIVGLLDRPDGGRVVLGDHEPWSASASIRAELRLTWLGFVFQRGNLIDHLSARENVALPAWRAGQSRKAALARADELLAPFGMADRSDSPSHVLSIGETQRVAVARALVNRPQLILADEPTGSLDGESARSVLAALLAPGEAAVLLVTHDPEVAARTSRTLHMRDGKLRAA
jgi:ABC-type lipoprotein export system ATPase subunit